MRAMGADASLAAAMGVRRGARSAKRGVPAGGEVTPSILTCG